MDKSALEHLSQLIQTKHITSLKALNAVIEEQKSALTETEALIMLMREIEKM